MNISKRGEQSSTKEDTDDLPRNRVAIIGGGAAAVSLCIQIVEEFKATQLEEPTEILVFGKEKFIGPGLPYSKKEDCYILNLPKEIMEPVYGRKGQFTKWLKEHPDCPQDTDFPPRYYFGLYLQFLADKIQKEAPSSFIQIKYYTNCEVFDLREQNEDFMVSTSKGSHFVNYAMLCTGHMPSSTYTQFIGIPGYIHDPWKDGAYDSIDSTKPVVIIGSRLTAIDVALKLFSSKYQGHVIMVSRSGLLPAVLSREIPPYPLKYLTLETFNNVTRSGLKPLPLDMLLELFWKEISEAEKKAVTFDSLYQSYKDISALDWITQEIKIAETKQKPWQQVLFSLYPIVPNIWSMLSLKDRKAFIKKYKSLFLTYLAAFPLDNAYRIEELLRQKRLLVKGGLQDITKEEDGLFTIHLETSEVMKTTAIINATGPGYNPLLTPLYKKLICNGTACKHHAGGIDVDPQTLQVLNKQGQPSMRLFAVGEVTWGACLATTDMTRVAIQSGRVATTFCHMRREILTEQKPYFYRNPGYSLGLVGSHPTFFRRSFSSISKEASAVVGKVIKSTFRSIF